MQHKNFTIDESEGIIRYRPIPDVDLEETIPISELLDMVLYFRSREYDIRRVVNKEFHREMERPLTLVGDAYLGITKEGARVTVAKADFDRVMAQSEQLIRENWLISVKEKRRGLRSGPELVILDEQGNPTLPKDMHGNPIPPMPELMPASCPIEVVQEELSKRRTVDFWNTRNENKTRGQWAKTP